MARDLAVMPIEPAGLARIAADWMAERIERAVMDRGKCALAVSGGTTPAAMFDELASHQLPWERVHVFQVDERVAPDGDADRNLNDLRAHLLGRVKARGYPMDVTNADLEGAAARYAELIATVCEGLLDVVHLGLGNDGHTASWPPGDPVIDVVDRDVALSASYKGRVRMTLTPPIVNRARHRMFLVSGASKRDAVRRLLAADAGVPATRVTTTSTVLLAGTDALQDAVE